MHSYWFRDGTYREKGYQYYFPGIRIVYRDRNNRCVDLYKKRISYKEYLVDERMMQTIKAIVFIFTAWLVAVSSAAIPISYIVIMAHEGDFYGKLVLFFVVCLMVGITGFILVFNSLERDEDRKLQEGSWEASPWDILLEERLRNETENKRKYI